MVILKKSEKDALRKWANNLTDDELENAYYDASFDSLGSLVESMYELGWDMVDIREREKYEKYLVEKANFLGELCEERGIKVWE